MTKEEAQQANANAAFVSAWYEKAAEAFVTAETHGFHRTGITGEGASELLFAEKIALAHSELSEALEGMRHGNPPSEKIPGYTNVEEELADCIIRIMDEAVRCDLRVAEAVVAKMAFNEERPYRHGKKF